MTTKTDVQYKYAIKVVEYPNLPMFVNDWNETWGFGWFNGTEHNAVLFDYASDAERAIIRRNAINGKMDFVVVPVKVTTTRILREETEESRVLA